MLLIEITAVSPEFVQAGLRTSQDFVISQVTDTWAVETITEKFVPPNSVDGSNVTLEAWSVHDYPANVLLQQVSDRFASQSPLGKISSGVVTIYAIVREFTLFPAILVPFVIDPYLKKFVNRSLSDHYVFILHGSDANSGQWLLGRAFLMLHGFDGRVYYPNYLNGLLHYFPAGSVDEVAERILVPELGAEVRRLLDLRPDETAQLSISVFGHSMGGDLLVELMHRALFEESLLAGADHSIDKPSYEQGLLALRSSKIRFRNLITLSGPFRGSAALSLAHSVLPRRLWVAMNWESPPYPDFEVGSDKARQLTRYIHNELVCGTRPWTLTQIGGGTDWSVAPESGLCVWGQQDDLNASCSDGRLNPGTGFVYVEAVGHYSSVAVSPTWRKVLQALQA